MSEPRTDDPQAAPADRWLTLDQPEEIASTLRALGWLDDDERVASIEKAGEGNMNLTLRVRTDRASVILKQARPWVEKYPQIPAPDERAVIEARFYQRVDDLLEVAGRMPRLLACDADRRLLLLEDLGPGRDCTDWYRGARASDEEIDRLVDYLHTLHAETEGTFDPELANREMRALNHAHLCVVPLQPDNGLDLDSYEPGLSAAAKALQSDPAFCEAVEAVGRDYLADGPCLLHGDFFPGSFLRTEAGLFVIDPEFCFFGEPAFDFGVLAAHLTLTRQADRIDRLFDAGDVEPLDPRRLARYAAVEVMRRLIGVAQLPIPTTDGWRAEMLHRARLALLHEDLEKLR